MKYLLSIILISIVLTGCATGRTEFKVISQATPTVEPDERLDKNNTSKATQEEAKEEKLISTTENSDDQTEHVTVTVKVGDTLSELCQQYLKDPWKFEEVARQNNIDNADWILPDQKIVFNLNKSAVIGSQPKVEPKIVSPDKNKIKKNVTEVIKPSELIVQISPTPTVNYPSYINKAFAPGERLFFSVEYFGVAAGYATLSVEPGMVINGRSTYHISAVARTHPAFEWVFKVRDKIESYVDVQGIFSWRYEKHLREGDYKNDTVMEYHQLEQKVTKGNGKQVYSAPPWVQDVLSLFYYYRVVDTSKGKPVIIPVLADDGKFYEVSVKVLGKEKITVPAGTFDCLKVEPLLKFEGLFKHQGKLHIWITNDKRKVPVLIRSKIIIGSIDIVLREAQVIEVE